jgi:phosphotransferase system  glucose/maltose/N-acetylglucosamine-specific IIC component
MVQFIVGKVQEWMRVARESYSVDPVIFVVLLFACAPFFYYSIFRLVKGLAKKNTSSITLWSSVFLGSTVLPYLYVLIFGRNMPWWIYIAIGLLVAQGVYSLVKKLRAKPAAGSKQSPEVERRTDGEDDS